MWSDSTSHAAKNVCLFPEVARHHHLETFGNGVRSHSPLHSRFPMYVPVFDDRVARTSPRWPVQRARRAVRQTRPPLRAPWPRPPTAVVDAIRATRQSASTRCADRDAGASAPHGSRAGRTCRPRTGSRDQGVRPRDPLLPRIRTGRTSVKTGKKSVCP